MFAVVMGTAADTDHCANLLFVGTCTAGEINKIWSIPVGMIYGIITIKTKSIWPAIFLHAAHNTFDQLIFGTVTVANNKMFFVSETGIFTIIFAWIVAVFLYKKCND